MKHHHDLNASHITGLSGRYRKQLIMLMLCFIMLLIDCIDNRYGKTCNEKCGHCNNNDVCEKSNGSCPSGCFAGYQGTKCKEGTLL